MNRFPVVRLDGSESSIRLMRQLNDMFAEAFEDDIYQVDPPGDDYLQKVLTKPETFALVALHDDQVVGGLVGYQLDKLEQVRSEVYLYDLAVLEDYRRQGIATSLIRELKSLASASGAWVVLVQADPEDEAAVALYESLGIREEVFHFDLVKMK